MDKNIFELGEGNLLWVRIGVDSGKVGKGSRTVMLILSLVSVFFICSLLLLFGSTEV
jgi:hypothetical protein